MKVVELKKACDLAQVERSGKKRVLQDLLLSAISRKTGRLEKKEPSINQDQKSILKKDAIIIHGMFSNASNMRGLKKSLAKRGCYRKIHAISINRLDHTHIPQLKAKENAKRICEIEIPKLKKNDKNFHRFDVIGHSNGGYVGLAMASMLEEDILDCVFTVATPKGIADTLIDYDIRHRSSTKIIHFRGGVDSVPFGYQHNPGNGGVVISFPDEGHSSIHL